MTGRGWGAGVVADRAAWQASWMAACCRQAMVPRAESVTVTVNCRIGSWWFAWEKSIPGPHNRTSGPLRKLYGKIESYKDRD